MGPVYASKNGMKSGAGSKFRDLTESELERHVANASILDRRPQSNAKSQAMFSLVSGEAASKRMTLFEATAQSSASVTDSTLQDSNEDVPGQDGPSEQSEGSSAGSIPHVRDDAASIMQQKIDACLYEVEQERQFVLRRPLMSFSWLQDIVYANDGIAWSPPQRNRESSVPRSTLPRLFNQDFVDQIDSAILEKPSRNYARDYTPSRSVTPVAIGTGDDFVAAAPAKLDTQPSRQTMSNSKKRNKCAAPNNTPENSRRPKRPCNIQSHRPLRPRYDLRMTKARLDRMRRERNLRSYRG